MKGAWGTHHQGESWGGGVESGGHRSLAVDVHLQRTRRDTVGRVQTRGEKGVEGVQGEEGRTKNAYDDTMEAEEVDGGREQRIWPPVRMGERGRRR
jgi:hypothetical protein